MNFSKLFFALISSVPLFAPLILILLSWIFFLDKEYKTAELSTLLFTVSIFLIIFILEKIFKESREILKNEEFSKKEIFNKYELKEENWKEIILPFTEHYKKESFRLIKKYNLTEKFELDFKELNILNVFKMKSIIGLLQTLQEVLIDIREEEERYNMAKDKTYTSNYLDCQNYLDYNNSFAVTETNYLKYDDNHSLGANHCPILMGYYVDKNSSLKSNLSKSNQSLTDYLPLSIFFTLFGVITMIASRNLLENYFTGLSLKIDTHYEEGDRVKIDSGEMMMVEDIGFRATIFYGIETNTRIVIPHQQLSNSVVVNYTQPTLDLREKVTIYVPDRHHHDRNIPKEAEKVLLLAAFIATGVKKPRLLSRDEHNQDESLKELIKTFKEHLDAQKFMDNSKKIMQNKNSQKAYLMNELLYKCEEHEDENKVHTSIYNIWKYLSEDNKDKDKDKEERIIRKLFLYEIYTLIHEINKEPKSNTKSNTESNTRKRQKILVIEKIFASIITILYDYETKSNDNLHHSVDNYCIKRKIHTLHKYDVNEKIRLKSRDELKDIAKQLVNISYYYFMLSKQLWELKSIDKSDQQKKHYDKASLEILDVPRVTSSHHRDYEGAFWEVNLLVTVELGEQSDEVIHHINMYIDDLWDIFNLPSRCNIENESSKISFRDRRERLKRRGGR